MTAGAAAGATGGKGHRSRRWLVPWLLMAPGLLWLILFFIVPNIQMFVTSLSTGSVVQGYEFTFAIENYVEAITKFPDNIRNSLVFGGLATTLCFLIGYPLAYGIAVRGGPYKSLLLFLVIAPFFTSFLIRTISWKIILGDQGVFLSMLRAVPGIPDNVSILGTPLAVVAGLTYEFLPFFVLPAYVSIEKIDGRLVEAARDLYAGPWRPGGLRVGAAVGGILAAAMWIGFGYASLDGGGALVFAGVAVAGAVIGALVCGYLLSEAFIRITFPLSLPGVFAGGILVFIPIVGDYVNAELLGNPKTQMIGNVIQNRFLAVNDYPLAAALSFLLMAGILLSIFIYARALGTEELTGGRAG
jgi:spermidine/putrescine transport system permease protein